MKGYFPLIFVIISLLIIGGCHKSLPETENLKKALNKAEMKIDKLQEFVKASLQNPRFSVLEQINQYREKSDLNLIKDIPAKNSDGTLNAVIEIPAGSTEKWEACKSENYLEWEFKNGKPRKIKYLGHPANYGFIPRSILPRDLGGDGDAVDIVVLGNALPRGKIVRAKPIGILKFLDSGEQDDKLIAIHQSGPFDEIENLSGLKKKFPGIVMILKTWFENYKGPGRMKFRGFGNKEEALDILNFAVKSYRNNLN